MQRYWVIGAGVLCLLGRAQAADSYSTYVNARFGYGVSYPSKLVKPMPESDNGDGRVFKSRDGKVQLTVWGENNVFSRSLKAQMNASQGEWAKDHAHVTYWRITKSFYVLSGVTGKEVFYEKTVPIKGGFATMLWQYPQSRKGTLSEIVTKTTRAFGSGNPRTTVAASTAPRGPQLAPRVALNAGKSAQSQFPNAEAESQSPVSDNAQGY